MTDVLIVGLDSRNIQAGNYGDFARDAEAAFEFHASSPLEEITPSAILAPTPTGIDGANYEALGQVVHVADDWWVPNVGVLVFQEASILAKTKAHAHIAIKHW